MEKQYCRVGTSTPITPNKDTLALLEYRYRDFLDKASIDGSHNESLREFFEHKAQKIKRLLESLIA